MTKYSLSDIDWYVYVLGVLWSAPVVALNEYVKQHDRRLFVRFQKRLKLLFTTKLGLHSPV